MESVFKQTTILTRRYIRYAGDFDITLGLVLSNKNVLLLFADLGGTYSLQSITSCPIYTKWLLDNYVDIMSLLKDEYPHSWYNDRNIPMGRKLEFKKLLKNLLNN